MEEAVTPTPRRGALLVIVQVLIALGGTMGYLAVILPDYGYEPAWPLNLGFALFLGLLWWLAVRGGRNLVKPGLAVGLLGFAGIVIGHQQLLRAEEALRAELNRCRYERLASEPDKFFNEEDALGLEMEKVFGPDAFERRGYNGFEPARAFAMPDPDTYPAMASRVEERKPGWPRILRAFARAGLVELRALERDEKYDGHLQVACGHYFSSMGTYGVLTATLRAEKRVMALAEADREIFLRAWKSRPVER